MKRIKTWSTPAGTNEEHRLVPCALCGGETFRPHWTCREENGAEFSYVRCETCGLIQINPQPLGESVKARYGESYLAYEQANEAAFLRLQELALKDAGFFELEKKLNLRGPLAAGPEALRPASPAAGPPEKRAPRLLDIGCATGALIAFLARRGWETEGIEIAEEQAAFCRSRGLEVSSLSLEEKAFPAEGFDVVLASHLIEHLTGPGAFVREVHRILKKGGRLYLTTPNTGGFQARLFGGRWRSAIFDHLYLFSQKTLRSLLESAGFHVERRRTWGGLAAGIAPGPVKAVFDRAAKIFGFGDVMILRSIKKPA